MLSDLLQWYLLCTRMCATWFKYTDVNVNKYVAVIRILKMWNVRYKMANFMFAKKYKIFFVTFVSFTKGTLKE